MFSKKLNGRVKRHPEGFGFFLPEEKSHPDVYIPKIYMTGLMSGDEVEILTSKSGPQDKFRGKVTKVIKRAQTHITGQVAFQSDGKAWLIDNECSWGSDLKLCLKDTKVKPGDWVHVQIKTYPEHPDGFTGLIESLIGKGSDPKTDGLRVLSSYGIPQNFSEKTLDEVKKFNSKVSVREFIKRKNLTKFSFVTIDGITAKDFDDAIYAEKIEGGFRIFVAIADVSHYVKPNTSLDKEAYERGVSTYFPSWANPMLPERLSNNLCSIKPNENRLTLVSDIKINFKGEIVKSKFYEAIINSKARITYLQAQKIIDGNCPKEFEHVENNIQLAADIAKILMKKRYEEGSLNLEIPETQVNLNSKGEVIDITRSARVFSHKVIEELMLLANVVTAQHLKRLAKESIYRIHESPKPEALEVLEKFLHGLGYKKKLSSSKSLQKKISQVLQDESFESKKNILSILILRSMKQAQYSIEKKGHFGLGFLDYTHFTSPIRRYPDLIVHRLLKASLQIRGYAFEEAEKLLSSCTWLSACEQRSVRAERQLISIKKARFIKAHLGKKFEGSISSITKFGIFVLLKDYDIDGLIRLSDLSDKPLVFDEKNLRLVGKKSGLSYSMGDFIEVQAISADEIKGRVDFIPAYRKGFSKKKKEERGADRRPKKNKSFKKGGKASKNRKRVRQARI